MLIAIIAMLIVFTTTCIAYNRNKYLCSSCRYRVKRNKKAGMDIDKCRLRGCPAENMHCAYYDKNAKRK